MNRLIGSKMSIRVRKNRDGPLKTEQEQVEAEGRHAIFSKVNEIFKRQNIFDERQVKKRKHSKKTLLMVLVEEGPRKNRPCSKN